MPDDLMSRFAFGNHLASLPPAANAGVVVRERTDYALAMVIARRGREAALAARLADSDIELPMTPKRKANGALAYLGVGPGRWLVTCDSADNANTWATGLARDLASLASVTDQSDGYAVIEVGGARARATLAKGVTVDLHPRAFRAGDVAVTQIAHIGAILWQLDDRPAYEIAMFRSLAGSFWHWLSASAAEFGMATMARRGERQEFERAPIHHR